mmetsp:Transcript_478/g.576  ORF Transcript_478/g.576 Transcript_478/m.576 type:complete len:87 (+) Transcript_478:72-332(+)
MDSWRFHSSQVVTHKVLRIYTVFYVTKCALQTCASTYLVLHDSHKEQENTVIKCIFLATRGNNSNLPDLSPPAVVHQDVLKPWYHN